MGHKRQPWWWVQLSTLPGVQRADGGLLPAHTIEFVGDITWVQRGTDNSTRQAIPALRTSLGASGSMWTKNPAPNCDPSCPFPEPLPNVHGHVWNCKDGCILGKINLVDLVRIPASIPPGDYVLSWRWDCEETTQVWTNCGDVTITAGDENQTVVVYQLLSLDNGYVHPEISFLSALFFSACIPRGCFSCRFLSRRFVRLFLSALQLVCTQSGRRSCVCTAS